MGYYLSRVTIYRNRVAAGQATECSVMKGSFQSCTRNGLQECIEYISLAKLAVESCNSTEVTCSSTEIQYAGHMYLQVIFILQLGKGSWRNTVQEIVGQLFIVREEANICSRLPNCKIKVQSPCPLPMSFTSTTPSLELLSPLPSSQDLDLFLMLCVCIKNVVDQRCIIDRQELFRVTQCYCISSCFPWPVQPEHVPVQICFVFGMLT